MKFSVIIPTYNRQQMVCDAIESALAQDYGEPYEVIVADDGSTDDTCNVLTEKYGTRIQVVSDTNGGPGAARNLGARHASGQYLAFLDSDDMFVPWTLSTYQAILDAHDNASIIMGCAVNVREPSEEHNPHRGPLECEYYDNLYLSNMAVKLIATDRLTVRREVFEEVGGFTTEIYNGEDIDFLTRAGLAPGYVVVRSPATFLRRYHDAQITGNAKLAFEGRMFLIDREQMGGYPGGEPYAKHRQQIIAFWARVASMQMLRAGQKAWAWKFYQRAFAWNVRSGRWLYLAGYPLIWLKSCLMGYTPPRRTKEVGS